MNHLPPTPEQFDRLVDGELSELQRGELLASLDSEPDGWRRCALAFLEAQCWKKELGDFRQTMPAGSMAVNSSARSKKRRSSPFGLPGTLLAMAVCFLLALGIGSWWQQWGNRTGGMSGAAGINQLASKNVAPSATLPSESQPAAESVSTQPENASAPWQLVRLAPAGSTEPGESVEFPAVQRDRIDQKWLESLRSPIPNNIVQDLRRNGYEVQTQQSLMPMRFKDGRRLVVPVDQVELHYVGNQTY